MNRIKPMIPPKDRRKKRRMQPIRYLGTMRSLSIKEFFEMKKKEKKG